nr:MAG TPA: hypothetical protein [Caudoviricetes sp.]
MYYFLSFTLQRYINSFRIQNKTESFFQKNL